jgi:hypothetical protein
MSPAYPEDGRLVVKSTCNGCGASQPVSNRDGSKAQMGVGPYLSRYSENPTTIFWLSRGAPSERRRVCELRRRRHRFSDSSQTARNLVFDGSCSGNQLKGHMPESCASSKIPYAAPISWTTVRQS